MVADETELNEARQHLARLTEETKDSSSAKNEFMSSMAHELRTPLNAIVGFASLLQMDADLEERQEYVRILRSNCAMLQRLIADIIEASSLNDTPTSMQPRDVNFASAFDDMCMTLHTRMNNPNITCIKDNPYTTYNTTLDTGRIQQVLTNFVINASKFTERGHIRMGYREQDGGLYFYCEDTGRGIPKDKQGVIFDRFVNPICAVCASCASARWAGASALTAKAKARVQPSGCGCRVSVATDSLSQPQITDRRVMLAEHVNYDIMQEK